MRIGKLHLCSFHLLVCTADSATQRGLQSHVPQGHGPCVICPGGWGHGGQAAGPLQGTGALVGQQPWVGHLPHSVSHLAPVRHRIGAHWG